MITNEQAEKILSYYKNDTQDLQQERKEFLEWLNLNCFDNISISKINEGKFNEIIITDNNLKYFEMWKFKDEEPIKSLYENLFLFNPNNNTRTKINSETCLEIDKLEYKESFNLICEVCASLIRNKIHFAVFYAYGQRSPHIRIYDFDELCDLEPQQRIKAQIEFWKQHVPFGMFQYIDTGIFVDEHPLQLEYAIHWKYGTPFDLLFEYNPQEEKCKD